MRRSILATAAAMTAVLALGACSSSGGSGTTSTEGSTAAATTAPALTGTLTVWVDETRIDNFKDLAKEYQAKTGVTVKLVQKASADIRTDFVKQVPTGQGPDVIIGAHDWTGQFVTNGVVQPIQLDASQYAKVAVSAFTYNGQVYGLPYAVENIALVRNNKLATDTPSTFDDLVAQGKKIGKKYSVLIQQGDQGDAYHLYPLQTSFGAPVFKQKDDGSYSTEIGMGGDNGHKFAEYLSKLGKEGVLSKDIGGDQAKAAFMKGDSPYIVTGPWYTTDFTKAGMDISVLKVPSAGGQESEPFVGVQGAFISAKTKNAVLANDFVTNFLGTEPVQTELYKLGGRLPALTASADKVDDPILKGFGEAAGTAPMPSIPEMDAVWQFWGTTQIQIISGQAKDPAKAWDTMVSNIQTAIDKK